MNTSAWNAAAARGPLRNAPTRPSRRPGLASRRPGAPLRFQPRLAGVVFLALCGVAGCGSNNGLTLGRVSGTVTYKGEPIRHGTVTFMPDESKGTLGPAAMGVIGNDGSYVLTTEETGDGAVVGLHKVGVLALGAAPIQTPGDDPGSNERDEARSFFATKAQTATGKPKDKHKGATFRERNGDVYAILTPESLTRPGDSGVAVKVASGSNKVNIAIQENGTALIEK